MLIILSFIWDILSLVLFYRKLTFCCISSIKINFEIIFKIISWAWNLKICNGKQIHSYLSFDLFFLVFFYKLSLVLSNFSQFYENIFSNLPQLSMKILKKCYFLLLQFFLNNFVLNSAQLEICSVEWIWLNRPKVTSNFPLRDEFSTFQMKFQMF